MTCSKCNTSIPEGGVYCPNCGERADGKKPCPNCGKYIDGNFCTYCGFRADGKLVCSSCGKEYDGNFCPFCGTKSQVKKKRSVANKPALTKSLFNLVSPAFILGALLIFFICSFFVGATITTGGVKEHATTIYYFGDAYSSLRDAINTLESAGITPLATNSIALLPVIFCTIFLAINLLVSFLSLVWGGIKYYKGVTAKEQVDLTKPLLCSLATFITATAITYATNSGSVSASSLSMTTSLSAGTISAVAICATLIVASLLIKLVQAGKTAFTKQNFVRVIYSTLVIVLSITVFCIINNYFTKISYSGFYEKGALVPTYITICGVAVGANGGEFNVAYYLVSFIAYVLIAVFFAVLIATTIRNFFEKKTNKSVVLLSSLTFTAILVYFVFGVLGVMDLRNFFDIINAQATVSVSLAGLILTLIFGVCLFALTICYQIYTRIQTKKQTHYPISISQDS